MITQRGEVFANIMDDVFLGVPMTLYHVLLFCCMKGSMQILRSRRVCLGNIYTSSKRDKHIMYMIISDLIEDGKVLLLC